MHTKRFHTLGTAAIALAGIVFSTAAAGQEAGAGRTPSRYTPLFATPAGQDTLRNLALWEDQRVTGDGVLFAYLASPNPLVRRRTVEVIGRIQDPDDVPRLLPLLADRNRQVAAETCFALGQIGSPDAVPALIEFCDNAEPVLLPRAVEALGKIGGPDAVALLTELLHDFNSRVRAQAAMGLARSADPTTVNALLLAVHDPDADVAGAAIYGLGKLESDRIVAKVQPFLSHDDPAIRASAAYTLGQQKNKSAVGALIVTLRDPDVGVAINSARALGEIGSADAAHPLGDALGSHPSHNMRRACAEALGRIGDKKGKDDVIQALTEESVGVRVAAIGALALILDEDVEMFAEQTMDDSQRLVRAAAIEAMGTGGVKNRVDMLMKIARTDEDPLMRASAVRALGQLDDDRAGPFLLSRLGDRDWVVTTEVVIAIGECEYTDAAAALADTWDVRDSREDVNIRIAILDVLTDFAWAEAAPLARAAISDPDRRVRARAAELLAALGETVRVPSEREINQEYFDPSRINVLMPPSGVRHAVITTAYGDINVELFGDDASQTVADFVALSEKGFYNGLTFHRVVPNFVIQGGDPRGDGWGDAGYFIKSEFNRHEYETGTLGVAHDGKDTGGCQFFITKSPQPRLDGRYTVFGRVTGGMQAVYQIDQADEFTVRIVD